MWAMDACRRLDVAVRDLQQVLLLRAEELGETMMPSYTHLQRAQPVLAAHWLLSHFWPLHRDRQRLAETLRSTSVLPLGSGAVAGSAFPVPRELLREQLGFETLSPNSIDAVSDRDFVAALLFSCTMIGVHASRQAEDLIIYGS